MKKLGIYIHVPFCLKKCNYCDFLSVDDADNYSKKAYMQSVIKEIDLYKDNISDATIDSIFFGGGTPSIIYEGYIYEILNKLDQIGNISKDCEISLESNPKTLTPEKLAHYLDFGINRLSIGAQSMDNLALNTLGRSHKAEDFIHAFEMAKALGFKNINIDLMFSIPGQTEKSLDQTIRRTLDLDPTHISFYSLKFEEGTSLYDLLRFGQIEENDEEIDRRMYWEGVNTFLEYGYKHYEISNFAKDNYACKHNLKYWSMDEYLGIGASASSFLNGRRWTNTKDIKAYTKQLKENKTVVLDIHTNSEQDNISEFIFTGLRKNAGIDLEVFKEYTGARFEDLFEKQLEEHLESGLLVKKNSQLFLTSRGIDISNTVLSAYIF